MHSVEHSYYHTKSFKCPKKENSRAFLSEQRVQEAHAEEDGTLEEDLRGAPERLEPYT